MPKLFEEIAHIAGVKCKLAFSYNAKEKFHISAGLPTHVVSLMPTYNLRNHETEASLRAALSALLSEYHGKIRSESIVLLVRGVIGIKTAQALGWNWQTKHPLSPMKRHSHNDLDYGFQFEFVVARLYVTGDKSDYKDISDEQALTLVAGLPREPHGHHGFDIVMPYTAERAAFLLQMQQALSSLSERMAGFFGQEMPALLDAVDQLGASGQLLLGGPASTEATV